MKRDAIALEDYIENSREWERDAEAQRVLKRLPSRTQQRFRRTSDRRYGRTGRRKWETLLEIIARDQQSFADMLPAGPTRIMKKSDAQYRATQKIWTTYAWQALRVLESDASLLGVFPMLTSPVSPGRLPIRLDLSAMTSAQQAVVLHWFAHAFRGLVRYRAGHPPLPFTSACTRACQDTVTRFLS